MTGVEILATEEVVRKTVINWSAFWIVFCVILAFFTILGILDTYKKPDFAELLVYILFGSMLGVAFGGIVSSVLDIPTEYETQYKVIISDDVSMSEFAEKYEIIDQEGKIYTIREQK